MLDHPSTLAASPDAPGSSAIQAAPHEPEPTMIIGRSYGPHPLPLGLDQPLQLRGGDVQGTDIIKDLPLDWIDGLASLIGSACKARSEAGRRWFSLPPFAMECPSPGDAAHVGRLLAHRTNVPLIEMDLASGCLDPANPESWESILPPKPVLAMTAYSCANPIVVVTGHADAHPTACQALATMLDPHTATTLCHSPMEAVFDLSAITWIVEVANVHDLHSALYSVLPRLHCKSKEDESFELIRRVSLAMAAMAECQIEPEQIGPEGKELMRELLLSPSPSLLPFSTVRSMIHHAARL